MAFLQVNKSRQFLGKEAAPTIYMAAYLGGDKQAKSKAIAFRMTISLINALGWEIVDRRVRLALFEGTGSDAGFLQLTPHPNGYTAVQGKHKEEGGSNSTGLGFTVTMARMKYYVLNECPVSSHEVNYVIDGNNLIIECPDWLRANLQAMEAAGVGAPKPIPEPEPEPERKRTPPNRHTRRLLGKEIARALR
jgi:hypothetical protein